MAGARAESVDFWEVLEEAEVTVECWPAWKRRYTADVFYEEELVMPDADWWFSEAL
jgi:hypothetical protein